MILPHTNTSRQGRPYEPSVTASPSASVFNLDSRAGYSHSQYGLGKPDRHTPGTQETGGGDSHWQQQIGEEQRTTQ